MLTIRLHLAVEVFAGSGHLSAALASAGFQVIMWDVELSSSHDLLIAHNRLCLMRILGACKFAHFGIPCVTYSAARRGLNGPRALRTASHLFGIPSLSASEKLQVKNADVLTSFTVKCVNRLRRRGIACTVENPHTSLLWRLPTFQKYYLHPEVAYVRTSFCMFGARWRKQIGILAIHFPLARGLASDCTSLGGRCCYSGLPHQRLAGIGPGNVWWTRIAQPYPVPLCTEFAQLVVQQIQQNGITERYCNSNGAHWGTYCKRVGK